MDSPDKLEGKGVVDLGRKQESKEKEAYNILIIQHLLWLMGPFEQQMKDKRITCKEW